MVTNLGGGERHTLSCIPLHAVLASQGAKVGSNDGLILTVVQQSLLCDGTKVLLSSRGEGLIQAPRCLSARDIGGGGGNEKSATSDR